MSARSAIAPVCRAFTAPIRASAIAGPSRIPLPTHRRSLQTEADASTSQSNAESLTISKLVVRTSQPLTSVLQAYAVLRSIESNYGQVIDFDLVRDTDSLRPASTLFFTMAEPVNLGNEREALHEIPSPQSSTGVMERYGGPSLADIRGILNGSSTKLPTSTKGRQSQKSITFKVETRRTPGWRPASPTKKTTPTTIRQDKQVLEALGKFGDGFFGGFKGLHEKHMAAVENRERNMRSSDPKRGGQNRRQGDRRETGDKADAVEENVEETVTEGKEKVETQA